MVISPFMRSAEPKPTTAPPPAVPEPAPEPSRSSAFQEEPQTGIYGASSSAPTIKSLFGTSEPATQTVMPFGGMGAKPEPVSVTAPAAAAAPATATEPSSTTSNQAGLSSWLSPSYAADTPASQPWASSYAYTAEPTATTTTMAHDPQPADSSSKLWNTSLAPEPATATGAAGAGASTSQQPSWLQPSASTSSTQAEGLNTWSSSYGLKPDPFSSGTAAASGASTQATASNSWLGLGTSSSLAAPSGYDGLARTGSGHAAGSSLDAGKPSNTAAPPAESLGLGYGSAATTTSSRRPSWLDSTAPAYGTSTTTAYGTGAATGLGGSTYDAAPSGSALGLGTYGTGYGTAAGQSSSLYSSSSLNKGFGSSLGYADSSSAWPAPISQPPTAESTPAAATEAAKAPAPWELPKPDPPPTSSFSTAAPGLGASAAAPSSSALPLPDPLKPSWLSPSTSATPTPAPSTAAPTAAATAVPPLAPAPGSSEYKPSVLSGNPLSNLGTGSSASAATQPVTSSYTSQLYAPAASTAAYSSAGPLATTANTSDYYLSSLGTSGGTGAGRGANKPAGAQPSFLESYLDNLLRLDGSSTAAARKTLHADDASASGAAASPGEGPHGHASSPRHEHGHELSLGGGLPPSQSEEHALSHSQLQQQPHAGHELGQGQGQDVAWPGPTGGRAPSEQQGMPSSGRPSADLHGRGYLGPSDSG